VFETETDKLQNFKNTFTILLFYILFNWAKYFSVI